MLRSDAGVKALGMISIQTEWLLSHNPQPQLHSHIFQMQSISEYNPRPVLFFFTSIFFLTKIQAFVYIPKSGYLSLWIWDGTSFYLCFLELACGYLVHRILFCCSDLLFLSKSLMLHNDDAIQIYSQEFEFVLHSLSFIVAIFVSFFH